LFSPEPQRARLVLLRDARSEPGWVGLRIADEEHGAVAVGRWRRDQHIVDLEVAIWREWNADTIRAVLGSEVLAIEADITVVRRPGRARASTGDILGPCP
jgi:hypothetical protein